jgi:cullin 4
MPEKVPEFEKQAQSKKRKHSPTANLAQSSQSTIPQLFAANSGPAIPKRSRRNSEEADAESTIATPLVQRTMLEKPVIDLTSSPPSTAGCVENGKPKQAPATRPPPFQPHAGKPRKLQVKNLKKPTKSDPDQYFNQTWTLLDAALTAIFNGQKISHSLEELYRGVENICRAEKAGRLFEKLKERCQTYVDQQLRGEIMEQAGRDNETFVGAVVGAWKKWSSQLASLQTSLRNRQD